MEFKKPNNYSNGRTRLTVPQREEAPRAPTVNIPSSSEPKVATMRQRLTSRKILLIAAIITAVVALFVTIAVITDQTKKADTDVITNPGYETILPTGKTITQLGGWERISPPERDPVFAYTDTINDVSINVSQQPLPELFKTDTTGKVAELAKSYNATKKINADTTTVYIGTSAQGPQSVIFTKNDLLVLIKSQENINDDAWVNYIKSLN